MHTTPQVLCSTGGFVQRDPTREDYRTILDVGPVLDVDGLEVLFYRNWYGKTDRIAEELKASGLRFPAVHAEKSIGPAFASGRGDERADALERLAVNCQFAHMLEASLVVFHLWGMPDSDGAIAHALEAVPDCLNVAAQYGVQLALETIPTPRSDPLTIIREAVNRDARCLIALDTEFLAVHNQLEEALSASWLWDYGRVRHVHVKDYDGQMFGQGKVRRFLHPGDGAIDFSVVFTALQQHRFDGCVSLEARAITPAGEVEIDRLQQSIGLIRQFIRDATPEPM